MSSTDSRPAGHKPAGPDEDSSDGTGQLLASARPSPDAPAAVSSDYVISWTLTLTIPRARVRMVAAWTAGTAAVVGIAWLLMSLITLWTTYATLSVTGWDTLTYGARSAKISFLVHNSGSGQANNCEAHLQLGNGQVLTRQMMPVPVGSTVRFYLSYYESHGPASGPSYAWATCHAAGTPKRSVPTVGELALVTSHPQLSHKRSKIVMHFELRDLGSQTAMNCRAFMRVDGGSAIAGQGIPVQVLGGGTASLDVSYNRSVAARLPIVGWAQCQDAAVSGGEIGSSRVHLMS